VLDDSNKPFYKWFVGAKTNIVHNAIDRHLTGVDRNKLAIILESEAGDTRSFSYYALNREVSQFASVLKSIANEEMKRSPTIEVCITVQYNKLDVEMEPEPDFWCHDLKALPIASPKCETEQLGAEDPLFILYTSGSTGKPKGMLHTHGGYSVYTARTHKMAFDIKSDD